MRPERGQVERVLVKGRDCVGQRGWAALVHARPLWQEADVVVRECWSSVVVLSGGSEEGGRLGKAAEECVRVTDAHGPAYARQAQ